MDKRAPRGCCANVAPEVAITKTESSSSSSSSTMKCMDVTVNGPPVHFHTKDLVVVGAVLRAKTPEAMAWLLHPVSNAVLTVHKSRRELWQGRTTACVDDVTIVALAAAAAFCEVAGVNACQPVALLPSADVVSEITVGSGFGAVGSEDCCMGLCPFLGGGLFNPHRDFEISICSDDAALTGMTCEVCITEKYRIDKPHLYLPMRCPLTVVHHVAKALVNAHGQFDVKLGLTLAGSNPPLPSAFYVQASVSADAEFELRYNDEAGSPWEPSTIPKYHTVVTFAAAGLISTSRVLPCSRGGVVLATCTAALFCLQTTWFQHQQCFPCLHHLRLVMTKGSTVPGSGVHVYALSQSTLAAACVAEHDLTQAGRLTRSGDWEGSSSTPTTKLSSFMDDVTAAPQPV